MPRIAAHQQHQKRSRVRHTFHVCLSFLVHLINVTDVCFAKYDKTVLIMQALIPSVTADSYVAIDDIVKIYKDELPAPNNCQEEF